MIMKLRWILIALLVLRSTVGVAQAACPATPEQLAATAERVIAAFIEQDKLEFLSARTALDEDVGCLAGVPSESQVAAIHLAYGLGAYRDGDQDTSLAHFQSMAMIEGWSLPAHFAEPTLVSEWIGQAAQRPSAPGRSYPVDAGYSLIVDGGDSGELPTGRAAIVVIRSEAGVAWSGVLLPGEDPPNGLWRPPEDKQHISTDDETVRTPVGHPPRWPWVGAGVAAGGAAALWVGFANSNAGYRVVSDAIDDGATQAEVGLSAEEIKALERARTAWWGGAGAATGAAIGLGVVGLALSQRTSADAAVSVGPAGVTLTW